MSKSNKRTKDEQAVRDVYDDLIDRCKRMQEYKISCYLDEAWVPNGVMPFDILIKNGLVTCKVYAESKLEAALMVAHELPVIVFLDNGEDDF